MTNLAEEPFNQQEPDSLEFLTDKLLRVGITSAEAAELPAMVTLKEVNPETYQSILDKLESNGGMIEESEVPPTEESTKQQSTFLGGPEGFHNMFLSCLPKDYKAQMTSKGIGVESFEEKMLTEEGAANFHKNLTEQLIEVVDKKQIHHQVDVLFRGFDLEDDAFFDDRTPEEIDLGIESYIGSLTIKVPADAAVNKDNINEFCYQTWLGFVQNRFSEVGGSHTEIHNVIERINTRAKHIQGLSVNDITGNIKDYDAIRFIKKNKLETASPLERGNALLTAAFEEIKFLTKTLLNPKVLHSSTKPHIESWLNVLDAIMGGERYDDIKPSDVSKLYSIADQLGNPDRTGRSNISHAIAHVVAKLTGAEKPLVLDNSEAYDFSKEFLKSAGLEFTEKDDNLFTITELPLSGNCLKFIRPNKQKLTTELQWANSDPYTYLNFHGEYTYELTKEDREVGFEIQVSEEKLSIIQADLIHLCNLIGKTVTDENLSIIENLTIQVAERYTEYVTKLNEFNQLDYCSKRAIQFITIYILNEILRVAVNIYDSVLYRIQANVNFILELSQTNRNDDIDGGIAG